MKTQIELLKGVLEVCPGVSRPAFKSDFELDLPENFRKFTEADGIDGNETVPSQ